MIIWLLSIVGLSYDHMAFEVYFFDHYKEQAFFVELNIK